MNNYLIINLLLLLLILFSCKRDFSAPDTSEIQLTEESAEVTEIWLKFKVTPLDTEAYYTVLRDTHIVFNGKLEKEDTLLHDKNLKPNYTYKYSVQSNTVTLAKEFITTMDTTSHNFEWQTFEFGDHSSSYFSDVAIVGEEIWAVGKIYTDSGDFNAAHWEGNRWNLKKIPVKIFNTNSFITGNLKAVYAFGPNNIYTTTGGEVIYYNGTVWGNWTFLFDDLSDTTFGGVNKFWGVSDTDFYGVGNKGNIFHYNGQTWQKLESGTDININDIFGIQDEQTDEDYILCTVSEKYAVSEYKLLQISKENIVNELNWPFPDRTPYSVWFRDKHNIFVAGEGIRMLNRMGIWKEFPRVSNYFKNCIRGNDINNVFVSGDFGLIAHFNGLTWWSINETYSGSYYHIDMNGDVVVAAGDHGSKARIIIMKRI